MKTLYADRKCFMFILVALMISFTHSSYGQTLTATSEPQPLTEVNLHNSVVTLTLTGGTYGSGITEFGDVGVSGIDGVTLHKMVACV